MLVDVEVGLLGRSQGKRSRVFTATEDRNVFNKLNLLPQHRVAARQAYYWPLALKFSTPTQSSKLMQSFEKDFHLKIFRLKISSFKHFLNLNIFTNRQISLPLWNKHLKEKTNVNIFKTCDNYPDYQKKNVNENVEPFFRKIKGKKKVTKKLLKDGKGKGCVALSPFLSISLCMNNFFYHYLTSWTAERWTLPGRSCLRFLFISFFPLFPLIPRFFFKGFRNGLRISRPNV